ncbi:EAL domain-containing protein [Marinobacterium jannaschii]|uniref:EAL domain-containing protein n=1 Tax=Marinobacterium jannaschii TaxID=64970 RepID=UPI000684AF74|nr:EAL domain-containing protein [Marinobacterium jannaschii]
MSVAQSAIERNFEMQLREILQTEALLPHFQPIVDLRRGDIIGYEALIRGPVGSPLEMPGPLFNAAIEAGLQNPLELLCRKRSLEEFAEQKIGHKLFLNISASLLGTPEHQEGFTAELLQQLGIPLENIVIEISEQHPFDHHGLSREAVEHYRDMGFKIAIDDLGTGYSGLKLWSELRPDYVKIDRHFVSGIDRDPVKHEFVRSICNIGQAMQCQVIAEGIEHAEELKTLKKLGIAIGQGFYLGYPQPKPETPYDKSRVILEYKERAPSAGISMSETAYSLLRPAPAVAPDSRVTDVSELLHEHPELSAIPVLKDGKPVGVVRRAELFERFSTQFGRALYEFKPVDKLLSRDVLIVESDLSLEKVSQMLTEREDFNLQQDMVIVQDGCYLGMGNVRDLLKRITDLKIRNARYSNPLTLLPGNVPINREIDALLRQTVDFRVAYFDLNQFKPFNDCYGYSKGDEVIRLLGDLLSQVAGSDTNFVGHVGGDDFVVLFRSRDWHQQCEAIIAAFDEQARHFYSPRDLEQEGIWASDRKGERTFFPLLGLAVGVVHPDPYKCTSYHEVAELAAMAKKEAKKSHSSCLFISRRRRIVASLLQQNNRV